MARSAFECDGADGTEVGARAFVAEDGGVGLAEVTEFAFVRVSRFGGRSRPVRIGWAIGFGAIFAGDFGYGLPGHGAAFRVFESVPQMAKAPRSPGGAARGLGEDRNFVWGRCTLPIRK